jgi:hypothetical protein
VTKPGATTQTSLTLSASSLAYGSEQAGTFTASVSGIGGPPTGQVTIQAGPTSVCTITLVNGSGACAPPASQLGLGSYQVTATYPGDATFASSASDPQALTVTG